MKCSVINCDSVYEGKGCECSFFHFPADAVTRKKWIDFSGQKKECITKHSYICMHHFKTEDFANNVKFELGFAKQRQLKRGAVPSINTKTPANVELYQMRGARIEKREQKKIVATLLKEHNAGNDRVEDVDMLQESEEPSEAVEYLDEYLSEMNSENIAPNVDLFAAVGSQEYTYARRQLDSRPRLAIQTTEPGTSEQQQQRQPNLEMSDDKDKLKSELKLLRVENKMLKKKNRKFASELRAMEERLDKVQSINEYEMEKKETELAKALYELKNLEEKLQIIFTTGQINKLKNLVKRSTWTQEDIGRSITFYATSPRLYKLLYRKQFPIPAVRTLQRWAQKIDISRGLLTSVFKILEASTQMTDMQKVCVLSFDEMKIRKSYCYDRSTDTTLGPVSYVQVAMLRGLMAKWKQPIFYDFDCKMTKDILFSMLEKTKSCGYTIVAMVSDLGGGNRSLRNELGVTEENPWFLFNDEKIFIFADVPHLIKLLRNHFIDQGFIINDKPVQKDIISKLLEATSTELTITHKISQNSLNVAGAKRQNVKLATKLFSHTIAQAITRVASQGFLEGCNWNECYQLFKLTNDWFDVMNVRVPRSDARSRCHAYGLALEEQTRILDQMTDLMKSMRTIGGKNLLPFQKGIIQSNTALKGLFEELNTRYGFKYVLTYRLNQDVLENFFRVIRSKGGLHDHPDQEEFKYRLRSYVLGRYEGAVSEGTNVDYDDTPDLELTENTLTGLVFSKIIVEDEISEELPEVKELKDMAYDGLENLAGYICHKLREEVPDIGVPTSSTDPHSYSWVNHLSEGGLTKPSPQMMTHVEALHSIFESLNQDGLWLTKNFLRKHLEKAAAIDCSEKVKKLFFRARMYFKIRTLNREIIESAKSKKRKFVKIVT